MKKFFLAVQKGGPVIFLAVILLWQSCFASAGFIDINYSPYRDSILKLQSYWVVGGYPDGTFRPANNISRAEFVKILLEAVGFDKESVASVSLPFTDIQQDAWYIPYVKQAYKTKAVQGYSDGTFRPGDNIRISEAYKIVMSTFFDVDGDFGGGNEYKPCNADISANPKVDVNAWYWKYFYVADEKCLVPQPMQQRMPGGLFDPGKFMQRGEMAELVNKSKKLTGLINVYPSGPLEYFSAYTGLPVNNNVIFTELYKYYGVNGTSKDALLENLRTMKLATFNSESKASQNNWLVKMKYAHATEGTRCRLSIIKVTLDTGFIYPNWLTINDADKSLVAEWQDYLQCLNRREYRHEENGIKAANEVYQMLATSYSDISCDDLDSKVKAKADEIFKAYNNADLAMDQNTQEGTQEVCSLK